MEDLLFQTAIMTLRKTKVNGIQNEFMRESKSVFSMTTKLERVLELQNFIYVRLKHLVAQK